MTERYFRSLDSDAWVDRLSADKDGAVHTEWLLLESAYHRDEDVLSSEYCTYDDSRMKVWAAFDPSRSPYDVTQFCRWRKDLAWLATLSTPASKFADKKHTLAHAIAQGSLAGVCTYFAAKSFHKDSEYIPAWQLYAAVKMVLDSPEKADESHVAVSHLLYIIYERFEFDEPSAEDGNAERQGKLLHSMISHDKSLSILHEYTFEDGKEGVGLLESQLPISALLPRSVFHLVLRDYSDLIEVSALRDSWPADVIRSYGLLMDLGGGLSESACLAWEQYNTKDAGATAPLPVLDSARP